MLFILLQGFVIYVVLLASMQGLSRIFDHVIDEKIEHNSGHVNDNKIQKDEKNHYIFLTENNEALIEWILLSIKFKNWLNGNEASISIIDVGSRDATLQIIGRSIYSTSCAISLYSYNNPYVVNSIAERVEEMLQEDEKPVLIDLRKSVTGESS